jgi:hypothetical protein
LGTWDKKVIAEIKGLVISQADIIPEGEINLEQKQIEI